MIDYSFQKLVFKICFFSRVKNFNLVAVPENQLGEFFMGDCYIVLYAYLQGTAENYILYYWIVSSNLHYS